MNEELAQVAQAIVREMSEHGQDPNLLLVSMTQMMSVSLPNPDGSQYVWDLTNLLGTKPPGQLAADFYAAYRVQRGKKE